MTMAQWSVRIPAIIALFATQGGLLATQASFWRTCVHITQCDSRLYMHVTLQQASPIPINMQHAHLANLVIIPFGKANKSLCVSYVCTDPVTPVLPDVADAVCCNDLQVSLPMLAPLLLGTGMLLRTIKSNASYIFPRAGLIVVMTWGLWFTNRVVQNTVVYLRRQVQLMSGAPSRPSCALPADMSMLQLAPCTVAAHGMHQTAKLLRLLQQIPPMCIQMIWSRPLDKALFTSP